MPLVETAAGSIWIEDNRHNASLPTVLMIHGAGGSHVHYPTAVRQMNEINAIIPDLGGHGNSPGEGRATISNYAADMIALLDALHIDKAVIAGHSMGGAIAMTLALEYPERVCGLILLSTGAKLSVHPDILNGVFSEFLLTARALMDWQWNPQIDKDVLEVIGYKTLIGTPAHIVYGDYVACNLFDVRARLAEIKVPTLIIGGTIDKLTPPRYSEYLHQHIAGSTLAIIENGAHMVIQEQPAAVADAIRAWLPQVL